MRLDLDPTEQYLARGGSELRFAEAEVMAVGFHPTAKTSPRGKDQTAAGLRR